MAVSLRWVVSGFIALVAVVCAVVAFVPTYEVGLSAVQTTMRDMRAGVMRQLTVSVKGFFAAPQRTVGAVMAVQKAGQTQLQHESTRRLLSLACDLMTLDPTESFMTAFFLMPFIVAADVNATTGRYIHCDRRFGPIRGGYMNSSGFFFYEMATVPPPVQVGFVPASQNPFLVLQFTREMFLSKSVWAQAVSQPHLRWSPLYAGYDSMQISAIFPFVDPVSNSTCMFSLDVLPLAVSTFLQQAGLRSRGRALIALHDSRIMIGNSWGEAEQIYVGPWIDLTLPDEQRMRGKRLADLSDALIARVVRHIGGEDAVFAIEGAHADVMGRGRDRVFVDVQHFRDEYGLALQILVAMPEIDFLGDVFQTRTIVIWVVVAVAVLMVVLAIVFATAITSPIQRLGDRMNRTAALRDGDADERAQLSLLTEVADVQTAYELMKQELHRLKGFLPDSVLHGGDVETDSEAEDDEGSLMNDTKSARTNSEKRSHRGPGSQRGRNDKTSTSSRLSRRSAAGAKRVAQLNTRAALAQKRVAVVVLNMSGFHLQIKAMQPERVAALQATMLRVAVRVGREHRGVIDAFHGDHIVLSFNAASTVQAYCRRAAQAAFEISAELRATPGVPPVRAGLAAGPAIVGNAGIPELQRFSIVGEVFADAWRCQAVCSSKQRKPYHQHVSVLTTSLVHSDIDTEFYCQHVDLASTCTSRITLTSVECYADSRKRAQHEARIAHVRSSIANATISGNLTPPAHAALTGPTSGCGGPPPALPCSVEVQHLEEDDEWMYVVGANSAMDPFRRCNAAFESLLRVPLPSDDEMDQQLREIAAEVASAHADDGGGDIAATAVGDSPKKGLSPLIGLRSLRHILAACDGRVEGTAACDAFATL